MLDMEHRVVHDMLATLYKPLTTLEDSVKTSAIRFRTGIPIGFPDNEDVFAMETTPPNVWANDNVPEASLDKMCFCRSNCAW